MHFAGLSKTEQVWILDLTKDDEFQKRFATDETLDKLEEEKHHNKDALPDILRTAGINPPIFGKQFGFLTVFKVAVLWALKNPFIIHKKDREITSLDIDIFFYVLNHSFDRQLPATARESDWRDV